MSKLVPCKSCEKEVAPSAKTCPNCGVKSPGVSIKEYLAGCLGVIILGFIAVGLLSMCSGGDDTKTSETYELDEVEYSVDLERPLFDWPELSNNKRTKYAQIFAFSLLPENQRADNDIVIFWGAKIEKCLDTAVDESEADVGFKIGESAAICWQLMKAK